MNTRATVAPDAQEPPLDPPIYTLPRFRLLLTFEDGKIVSSQVIRDGEYVMDTDGFRTVLKFSGYSTVPTAAVDYLKKAAGCLGEGHG